MTESTDTPRDNDTLAAELVSALATGDDLTSGRRRMATDEDFARKMVFWQERITVLTDGIDPAKLQKAMFACVFPKAHVPILQRVWLWQGVSVASLSFAGYMGVKLFEINTRTGPPRVLAAQLFSDTSPLQVLAVVELIKHEIALRRVPGDAIPNLVFELWAILPRQAPVSFGVLRIRKLSACWSQRRCAVRRQRSRWRYQTNLLGGLRQVRQRAMFWQRLQ
jgi:anti-sigma-K factor RskA